MLAEQDRLLSPIEIRVADDGEGPDGITPAKYWMRARDVPTTDAPFQKVAHSSNSRHIKALTGVQCLVHIGVSI